MQNRICATKNQLQGTRAFVSQGSGYCRCRRQGEGKRHGYRPPSWFRKQETVKLDDFVAALVKEAQMPHLHE